MSPGPAPSPELIEAVRQCAAANMSSAQAADKLTTRLHPLTRSAVLGIAYRNGIKFSSSKGGPTGFKPKDRRTIPARLDPLLAALKKASLLAKLPKPRPSIVTVRASSWVAPPGLCCSWERCGEDAEPGDMFCFSHGRKGLFGS